MAATAWYRRYHACPAIARSRSKHKLRLCLDELSHDRGRLRIGSDDTVTSLQILLLVHRLITTLIFLVIGLGCAGAAYQAIANFKDVRRFPQQGKLVQVGALQLNIDCSGRGKPTVVLESAGNTAARGWAKVQPEVAKFTRVCSYDRAGYGWSKPGLQPRSIAQEAEELKLLLQAAGETGPYILVGHSQGGFNVRAFAHKYPEDVIGVVLVDASHPEWAKQTQEVLSQKARFQNSAADRLMKTRLGLYLWTGAVQLGIIRMLTPTEDTVNQEINYLRWKPKAIKAFWEEYVLFDKSADHIRALRDLGDRPLIVLTAGQVDEGIYGNPADAAAVQKEWVDVLQKDLVRLSSRGRQIIVPDSGHMIPMERPEAIVSAIREIWEETRTEASP
jgi:pimeloyl-ACP methyl ester carboxylesterase